MLTRTKNRNLARHDAGLSLPELLIVMSVMGILATVVAFPTIVVSYRTVGGAEGHVNVARAEQAIDTWLPADLASTDVTDNALPAVNMDPLAEPCGNCPPGLDLSGVNALQLAWKTVEPAIPPAAAEVRITTVQYQYIQKGEEWVMERIECVHTDPCTKVTVLHDLKAPEVADFDTNPVSPTWVMEVSVPTDPATLGLSDNARQILVKIDGGGEAAGAGGGSNSVSLTAGGTTTREIEADDFSVPSFVRAKSRCGGPVSLIVDDSNSVGTAVDSMVEPGVRSFIEAFRGTPTQLQIIPFDYYASTLGPGTDWHKYFDMTDDAQVDTLKAAVSSLNSQGGTNWEDAFFRALHNENGDPADIMPNRIVFFTDGIATQDRTTDYYPGKGYTSPNGYYRTGAEYHPNAGPYDRGEGWVDADRNHFSQESWDRTDALLDPHRGDIDLTFVGVGSKMDDQLSYGNDWHEGRWVHDNRVYTDLTIGPGPEVIKESWETIAHLLMNVTTTPSGEVEGEIVGGEVVNGDTANFYNFTNFDPAKFGAAMRASALKDCGGTLTIQTKLQNDGSNVVDEFVYENTQYFDDDGTPVPAESRRVTTSAAYRTGTFDFEIPSTSNFFTVEVVPQELETLTGFDFESWTCKAGGVDKASTNDITEIDIPDSDYEGISVKLNANEALSCIMEVSQP